MREIPDQQPAWGWCAEVPVNEVRTPLGAPDPVLTLQLRDLTPRSGLTGPHKRLPHLATAVGLEFEDPSSTRDPG
jgi:hypothetical protein